MNALNTDTLQTAWRFAAERHRDQEYPGTGLPYLMHLGAVCLELYPALAAAPERDAVLALTCAILHDTVEDTGLTSGELAGLFGEAVAQGVAALSKNPDLHGAEGMGDSLKRIREQPPEVWMVKMADRCANLGKPPAHWNTEKCRSYADEGETILEALGAASPLLTARLAERVRIWRQFAAQAADGQV
ncbi:MAG: bifunctional (p)ppGpp synthetase/guanosine-3',5'-bis(diphosphate) 3'-pyrophosphohydrolase [Deltaproteobacteria bacterium]|nr:bifunctional (p)ppGpp synthetase/guanosine-3',5'-bis(diphosphate) 3'-pyrophosphohydrolase [Deltaproteobacteria bacterium]